MRPTKRPTPLDACRQALAGRACCAKAPALGFHVSPCRCMPVPTHDCPSSPLPLPPRTRLASLSSADSFVFAGQLPYCGHVCYRPARADDLALLQDPTGRCLRRLLLRRAAASQTSSVGRSSIISSVRCISETMAALAGGCERSPVSGLLATQSTPLRRSRDAPCR